MNIIDGKKFAENLRKKIAEEVEELKDRTGKVPGLAVVLVGNDPASQVYVANKAKQTKEVGMNSYEHVLTADTSQKDLLHIIKNLNANENVHGILVQLPLPKHISEDAVINAISPEKDVDGFHVVNRGRLITGQDALVPCTPLGCLMLLKDRLFNLEGLHAVVIGRSNIVGKPMAQLLLNEGCTVTVCHSKTKDIKSHTQKADIIVVAVGKPNMLEAEWIKEGATIIDVGINRVTVQAENSNESPTTKLVGDVNFNSCKEKAGGITPVPGGVGPMTIACLLSNTLKAFKAGN
ncbi:MAG TPA: bifunctional methylenetetrahydrofolate dehydrogenase/methenyltetrahydrofolate cyclohydrolase FolD [Alphaproteobacteria bacterium]|nr:bifunctional methylenetetrahydrofolate dehydrogenase/methenyltetrahydrofolate cyclohydrolase FolD [Alphaproteobacteria bacterium]